MRSPFMKFMNHSASFIFFLGLLVYASIDSIPCKQDKRGRGLDWVEATIMVFAFGNYNLQLYFLFSHFTVH